MERELIEQEIERQKTKLFQVLRGNMQEPERSQNIVRITKTISSLKDFLNSHNL